MWLNSAMTLAVAPGGSVIARLVSVIAVLDVLSLPGSTGQSYLANKLLLQKDYRVEPDNDTYNYTRQ